MHWPSNCIATGQLLEACLPALYSKLTAHIHLKVSVFRLLVGVRHHLASAACRAGEWGTFGVPEPVCECGGGDRAGRGVRLAAAGGNTVCPAHPGVPATQHPPGKPVNRRLFSCSTESSQVSASGIMCLIGRGEVHFPMHADSLAWLANHYGADDCLVCGVARQEVHFALYPRIRNFLYNKPHCIQRDK